MKAYAIAAETIKAQAMLIHTARRCLRRSFLRRTIHRARREPDRSRRRMGTSSIGDHRISFTRCRSRLVSVSRISKSDSR
jgi:hypothetical protein